MVVCMLLCCFKRGWIAPHNYNDHKGQINGVVLIQSRNDEHTLGFRDQVIHVQTIHREVNTLELTSRTMADRWLLFEPVKLWFHLLNVYVHIKTHSHTYTHTHTCFTPTNAQTTSLEPALIPPSCSIAGGWVAYQASLMPRRMPVLRPHTNRAAAEPHREIVNESRGFCSTSTHPVVYFIRLVLTHTQHNAGRQQLGACLLVNYSTTSSINLQAKVLKVNQPKRSFDRLRNSPNIVSSELYASNVWGTKNWICYEQQIVICIFHVMRRWIHEYMHLLFPSFTKTQKNSITILEAI